MSWAVNEPLLEGGIPVASPSTTHAAPVIFNGRELTEVVGIRAYPVNRRASEITEQINAIAGDSSIDPETLSCQIGEPG